MILSQFKRHATDYRADIDGLRAIAILFVVIYHAFPASLKKGFMGVDVFFVISGFLITKIILNELNNGVFTLKNFYLRRAKRILPALFMVLALTLFASLLILTPQELKSLAQHTIASLLFVENFLLLKEVGYFDIAADTKPLLHLWSLAVEEQFYIIIPLLLIALHKLKVNILPFIIFFIVSTLIYNIYLVNGAKQLFDEGLNEAFYMLYARMWELSFGSLAAWLTLYKPHWGIKNSGLRNGIAAFALILLALAAFGVIRDKVQAIYAVIPTFILIYLTQNSVVNNKLLATL